MLERLQPASPPLRHAWSLLITLQGRIVSPIKFTECWLLDFRNLSKLMRRTGGGQKWKHPKHPTFFWLHEVSCAWPTALARIHSIYVYFSLLPQALKANQRLTACHKYVIWTPCWLAENIPGLITVLKTWVLQIRDITGASAPRRAAVMLLQNVFEYFSILSYLHASKANPSLKSWSKHSSQILVGNHKGKRVTGGDGLMSYRQSTHSKCKKTLSKQNLSYFFQVRHQTDKCAELNTKPWRKRHNVVLEEQARKVHSQRGANNVADSMAANHWLRWPWLGRSHWLMGELGFVCKIPLWAPCLMKWCVRTSLHPWPIVPMLHYLICRSVVTAVIHTPLSSSQGLQVNII